MWLTLIIAIVVIVLVMVIAIVGRVLSNPKRYNQTGLSSIQTMIDQSIQEWQTAQTQQHPTLRSNHLASALTHISDARLLLDDSQLTSLTGKDVSSLYQQISQAYGKSFA